MGLVKLYRLRNEANGLPGNMPRHRGGGLGRLGCFRNEAKGWATLAFLIGFILLNAPVWAIQDDGLVVRPGPPSLDDFESDEDDDGIPDGWYNLRDAQLATGGVVGPTVLRFENDRPGRPARASRAFGIDGRKTEALILGLWVRVEGVEAGERLGENPGLVIDFLSESLRPEGRGMLGPWDRSVGDKRWVRVAKRLVVPIDCRDAILSVGLLGATGVLEIDGLTIEEVHRGGQPTTDLILNGGLELGDPDPAHWIILDGARRVSPGRRSDSALELSRSGAIARAPLALPVARFEAIEIRLAARALGLRGGGGATGSIYFVDESGRTLPGAAAGARPFRFAGSTDWQDFRAVVRIPRGAAGAVLQFEKTDGQGTLRIDDVAAFASPGPERGRWTPYHVATESEDWRPYPPAPAIATGSALDASFLLEAPAGTHGRVEIRDGRLVFADGTPARFFGAAALPPLATINPERAEALADDLARRGVNLVRFSDLDSPLGPALSLIDDASADTATLDPMSLDNFDRLVAALKARGIYVAIELIGARRFRPDDGVAGGPGLPPGGGPSAAFDPRARALILRLANDLLGRVNPHTGLPLRDDPALAWVTISGEQSALNLIDDPNALPPASAALLRELADRDRLGSGRRLWQTVESEGWKSIAETLREGGLQVPIAGTSHWRREAEFVAAQSIRELDLIDDRLFWPTPTFAQPDRRSMVRHPDGAMTADAAKKRRGDRPYLVGQWAARTDGAWALPYEAADLLLIAQTAAGEGWGALVRRGLFLHPEIWGAAAPGTSGGADLFPIAEILNANPAAFAVLPHAASIYLRHDPGTDRRSAPRPATWDPATGRLVVATPHTRALAGWSGRAAASEGLSIEHDGPFAVVAVTSIGPDPVESAHRLLVTAVGRAEPTGLTYADGLKREAADPGRPPILMEPVRARVLWKRRGEVRAFALDSAGNRTGAATLESTPDGFRLVIDGRSNALHYELIAGPDDGQRGEP